MLIASAAAPGQNPRDLPELLRHALAGRNARQRLMRLLTIAEHASIHDTARALSLTPSILYSQVARLERHCGGTLIQRSPRPADAGTLTPLGEQLRRQARDYIGLSISPGQQTSKRKSAWSAGSNRPKLAGGPGDVDRWT